MVDDVGDQLFWAGLRAQATPLLMLELPVGARALEAGVGSAGALLVLGDLLGNIRVADTDAQRLARLKRLPAALVTDSGGWTAETPARALRRWGPVDLLVLSAGLADLSASSLAAALAPGAQFAVAVLGLPGAALRTKRRLLAAGLRDLSIMAPWPSATHPAAWVDLESASAWRALQGHFRPSTRTRPKRVLAAVWREAAERFPNTTRAVFRNAATVAYVMGRR
jgi:hypothetical protein